MDYRCGVMFVRQFMYVLVVVVTPWVNRPDLLVRPQDSYIFISMFILLCFSTLRGRTGSSLVWHSEGRMIAADSVQQVLRFAARIAVCNTWSSGGTALCRVGVRPVNWIYRL